MPEIQPDLSDQSRCISVHWSLPVQCVLHRAHAEVWHEAWHPETGNRVRYRRNMGVYRTEELSDGWHDLEIPPPGSVRNIQASVFIAAARLMTYDLPEVAYWQVTRDGRLIAQPSTTRSDAGDLAAVHAWATFLGAEMRVRNHAKGQVYIWAEATWRGARVEVWTSLTAHEPPENTAREGIERD